MAIAPVTVPVEKMKGIVIMMMNAKKIIYVDLTIAEVHLALNHFMIVAIV